MFFSDLPGVFGFVVKLVEIYAWLSLFWYTCVAPCNAFIIATNKIWKICVNIANIGNINIITIIKIVTIIISSNDKDCWELP